MKRLSLSLPIYLLGLPLTFCLLVASSQQKALPAAKQMELPPLVAPQNGAPAVLNVEKLVRDNPIAFLEQCLRRYQQDVKSYQLVLQKQEFVGGKLHPREVVEIAFREQPHSVYMRWLEGARNAERVLYVDGENDGKLLARPNGAFRRAVAGDVVLRDVDSAEARQSGRVTIDQFGLKKGTERTLVAWKAAKESNALTTEYLGEQKIKELEDRVCYVLRRAYKESEGDGVMELTIFVDKETLLQTGSIVKGEGGKLLAEYYFRDIRLNPEFKKDQFERSALTP